MNDRQIRRFCRRITAKCPRAFRSRLKGELKAHIADFLQEHPDADEAALAAHIGQPEEYAAAFVDGMSETECRSLLRRRRLIRGTVIAAALLILATACVTVWQLTKRSATTPIYYVEEYIGGNGRGMEHTETVWYVGDEVIHVPVTTATTQPTASAPPDSPQEYNW